MDPRFHQQQSQPAPPLQQQQQPPAVQQQYNQYQQSHLQFQPSSVQQQQQPQVQPRPTGRNRAKSGFSLRSESSDNSHKRKESLQETATEKRRNHMSSTTKANPNAAISEAQPIALALEKSTIGNLQGIKCNDIYGNPINDPDRSNPTRWRMERPLDTIKSFEHAISRAHAHRSSSYIQPGQQSGIQSQRSSSYWGQTANNNGDQSGRLSSHSGNGQYGMSREELTSNEYGTPPMRQNQRMPMEPTRSHGQHGQPGLLYPVNTRSKDTINTGNSSNSEQWNPSTNPTSEEGSIDRVNGVTRPIPPQHQLQHQHQQQSNPGMQADGYGSGYSDDEYGYNRTGGYPLPRQAPTSAGPPLYNGNNGGYQQHQSQLGGPPPPSKGLPGKTVLTRQTSIPNGAAQPTQERSSWFKKRFSRQQK